jgi:hypothetical protein
MNPRILTKGQNKITQFEKVGSNMEWASVIKVKRKDALTKVVDLIVDFWTNETRVSPNKRDAVKHRTNKNKWEEHAIHFLEKP